VGKRIIMSNKDLKATVCIALPFVILSLALAFASCVTDTYIAGKKMEAAAKYHYPPEPPKEPAEPPPRNRVICKPPKGASPEILAAYEDALARARADYEASLAAYEELLTETSNRHAEWEKQKLTVESKDSTGNILLAVGLIN
jgi:hypothetical protein